jgi:RimJ/RimL family protein N-acetyltransferase
VDIQFRDLEPADLPLIFQQQRDPIAVAMAAFRSRDRAEFDSHWAKQLADASFLARTIVVDGQIVGHLASFFRNGVREVGYWIDQALWGRGIATASLWAFLQVETIRPLYAGVVKHNAASIRILQKCGFELTQSAGESAEGAEDSGLMLTRVLKP